MKVKFAALASAAVLAATTAANAGVVATLTSLGAPTDGFDTLTGYTAYTVTLTSDSGKITAVDFSGAKAFGGAAYSQSWFKSVTKSGTTFAESPFDTSATADVFDSHFIVPGGNDANILVVGGTASEFGPLVDNALSVYNPLAGSGQVWGDSNGLGAAFGIVGAAQTSSMTVAYIVVKDDTVVAGEVLAAAAIATENGTFNVDVAIPGGEPVIPVPAAAWMGLAGLAGVVGVARRRMAR